MVKLSYEKHKLQKRDNRVYENRKLAQIFTAFRLAPNKGINASIIKQNSLHYGLMCQIGLS